MSQAESLHYLVCESGSRVIAHCLEHDLVASADSYHEAIRRLTFIVGARLHTADKQTYGKMSLEHRAPEMFWQKFEALRESSTEEVVSGVHCTVARAAASDAIQ